MSQFKNKGQIELLEFIIIPHFTVLISLFLSSLDKFLNLLLSFFFFYGQSMIFMNAVIQVPEI